MLSAPAANRNKQPILTVLKKYLDSNKEYKLLEIASGTGEHCQYFAEHLKNVTFQPSEINARYLHSIVAYVDQSRLPNIRVPLQCDATKDPSVWALPYDFGPAQVDVIFNANMIHISSNAAVDGLFRAASGLLKPKTGKLITYGPYAFNGVISPQSNIDFNNSLKMDNPEWGLRDVEDLKKKAELNGLQLEDVHALPANNHILVFSKN